MYILEHTYFSILFVWSTFANKYLCVCDALQKKYLKTLLFCICEKEEGPMIEEYACKFHPVDSC